MLFFDLRELIYRFGQNVNINNFDFESLANCLKDYKDKKSIEIPTWDKEKGVQ